MPAGGTLLDQLNQNGGTTVSDKYKKRTEFDNKILQRNKAVNKSETNLSLKEFVNLEFKAYEVL